MLHEDDLRDGCYCPTCERWAKMYKRPLNSTQARGLIWLYKMGGDKHWVNITCGPQWLVKSNQLSTTKHWDLVRQKPNTDPTKKTSGIWRLTDTGTAFVEGRRLLRKYRYLFNDVCFGSDTPMVSVRQTLGVHFNYSEMMAAEIPEGLV